MRVPSSQYHRTTRSAHRSLCRPSWWHGVWCLALVSGLGPLHAAHAAPGAALSCPSGPGVLHVGPGETYATLNAAVTAASNGNTICVDAGLYTNDFVTTNKNLTIRGVGGLAHFEQTIPASMHPNGKATIVTSGNLTIEALEFSGADVNDNNGAAIRYEGGDLTIRQSYFHDNEEGILGSAGRGNVVIEDSKFVDNGFGTGQTHGIYLSLVNTLTVDNSYFDSTHVGHHVKIIAPANGATISNSTLEDGFGVPATKPSYSVDAAGGGDIEVHNNTINQRVGAQNPAIVHYSTDQAPDPANPPGHNLTIDENVVRNDRHPGTLLLNQTSDSALITDNQLVGVDTIAVGPATISGNQTSGFTPHSFVGPLLGLNGADGEGQIAELNGAGALTGMLAQPSGIVGNTGIASLNGNIYVANRIQGVGIVDPETGSSTAYRGPQGIEALGTYQDMLIAGVFDTDSIVMYSVDPYPTPISTIQLQIDHALGITGLDLDETNFYVGSYGDGNVYVFNPFGALLDTIITGLTADILSGLAYDRGNDTLWLSTGYGDNRILHYDLTGTLLDSVMAPIGANGGLDVFAAGVPDGGEPPPSDAAEPPSGIIFALAALALFAGTRQRRWRLRQVAGDHSGEPRRQPIAA